VTTLSPPQPEEVRAESAAPARDVGWGGHMPALDGLRGVAILLVLLFHTTLDGGMRAGRAGLAAVYHAVTSAGWCGVDLFYVLSGFLITGILVDARGAHGYFRAFYARRALRILPLYYGVLALAFVVWPSLGTPPSGYDNLLERQGWYWAHLVNVLCARDGWHAPTYFQHFWSLSVEEQFYLVWPLAVCFLARRSLLVCCTVMIGAALAFRWALVAAGDPIAAYVLMPARMDGLAIGGAVALLARSGAGRAWLERWRRPIGLAAAGTVAVLALSGGGLNQYRAGVQTIGYLALALAFGSATAAVATGAAPALQRSLRSRWLRFLGKYSYALYVFHYPLISALKAHGFSVGALPTVAGSELPAQLIFTAVLVALAVALALLSWHAWEAPFLGLKRYVPMGRATSAG
jgi:peptidoglycan/LPS O-acetylase OafA/YrhL